MGGRIMTKIETLSDDIIKLKLQEGCKFKNPSAPSEEFIRDDFTYVIRKGKTIRTGRIVIWQDYINY